MALDPLPAQQLLQEMLIDPAQAAYTHLTAKLMEHPGGRPATPQTGKPSPGGLFGQLPDQEIERTGGRQPRQQMHAPQLRRTQTVPPPTGEITRTKRRDKIVGHVSGELFEQGVGANGRQ